MPRKNYDRFSDAPVLNDAGKQIIAQWNDYKRRILQALSDHNVLTFQDLHAIVGGDRDWLYDTLRILKARNNGYIRLLPDCQREQNLRRPLVFQITQEGVKWAASHRVQLNGSRRVHPGYESHALLTSHIVASIHTGVAQQHNARIVSWEEMQDHPKFGIGLKDQAIIPDTHPFRIEHTVEGKRYWRTVVVEADNGTESNKTRIKEKFELYTEFMRNREFTARYGVSNYFVLFVFTNRTKMDNCRKLLETLGGNRFILFQETYEDAPPGYIFTSACERAGHPPLFLNQPEGADSGRQTLSTERVDRTEREDRRGA